MPQPTAVSVVINTKNSASTLERTLASVTWAAELIVVDMQSTDDTRTIAQKYGARIELHPDVGYVEPARAAALALAKHPWTLLIDDDEIVTPTLKERLITFSQQAAPDEVALAVPRKNIIFGTWISHTGWWPDYQIRFFRTGKVHWPAQLHAQPAIDGTTIMLPAEAAVALEHYNYPTVTSYLRKLDRYTSIAAHDTQIDIPPSAYPASILSAFRQELLQRLVGQEGWKDQSHGVYLSLMQASSEATRVFKAFLPHLTDKRAQLSASQQAQSEFFMACELAQLSKELHFWACELRAQQSTGLAKLWWKLRKRVGI